MKFKGKISRWWYVTVVFVNVFCIGVLLFWGMNSSGLMLFIPPWILLDLYLLPVLFKNEVTVDKADVTIQFGLFRKSVLTQSITGLQITKSMSSSFAASSDRVAIDAKGFQTIYVALEDNKGFVEALKRFNRKIKYTIG